MPEALEVERFAIVDIHHSKGRKKHKDGPCKMERHHDAILDLHARLRVIETHREGEGMHRNHAKGSDAAQRVQFVDVRASCFLF